MNVIKTSQRNSYCGGLWVEPRLDTHILWADVIHFWRKWTPHLFSFFDPFRCSRNAIVVCKYLDMLNLFFHMQMEHKWSVLPLLIDYINGFPLNKSIFITVILMLHRFTNPLHPFDCHVCTRPWVQDPFICKRFVMNFDSTYPCRHQQISCSWYHYP